jgi:beta-lactamase superfamily II metal-dependent hydrolase
MLPGCDSILTMRLPAELLLLFSLPTLLPAAKTLDVYFIDVEGGQATLAVSPSGESMLVDAGWPGYNGRDAGRIAAAARAAGVKRIDYLVTTHYHTDHVGGVPEVAAKLPVRTFVDHGATVETSKTAKELYEAYEKAAGGAKRISVKPGDTIPVKGIDVKVLTASGDNIQASLQGGGAQNPLCAGSEFPEDPSENARSLGTLITFGKFRLLNLGDLTSREELDLVCPANRIGRIDVYLTTHHGLQTSNAQAIVHAVQPRVAIMNNGAKKGGSPEAWTIIRKSPGLEDLWQLHFAIAGGSEHNVPESMIANLVENCEGKYLKLSANQDGSFSVLNSRNKYQKSYAAK